MITACLLHNSKLLRQFEAWLGLYLANLVPKGILLVEALVTFKMCQPTEKTVGRYIDLSVVILIQYSDAPWMARRLKGANKRRRSRRGDQC